MIKANELRLGNWIVFNNFLSPEKYIQVNATFFSSWLGGRNRQEIKNDEVINKYYSGIPLTPEILEKCGFEQDEFITRDFFKQGFFNFKAVNHYEDGFLVICNFMQGGIKVKYLHQLQNLYFALSGEELNIKLYI